MNPSPSPAWRVHSWHVSRVSWHVHWPVILAGLAVTAVLILISPDFGVTRDEPIRNAFGEYVIDYWRGTETRFQASGQLRLYGGLFDATAVLVHHALGGDLWIVRHRVNAAFCGIGILAIGLVAARLFGTATGLLTILLLSLSPRFVAHAVNNPKDAPFAALCSVAVLSFTLLGTSPPFLTWARSVTIGLALALPLNVRAGALLYWGYLGLTAAALHVRAGVYSVRALSSTAARLALVTLVMLLAGCLTWPWALGNPIVRPFQALFALSDFGFPGKVLFQGQVHNASNLPASYLPVLLSLTNPPVVLAGAALSVLVTLASSRRRLLAAGLWVVVLFPIVSAILKGSTLYNGWRHVLFVYPPLVVLAALGWYWLWERGRSRAARALVVALLATGCLEPLWFMIRNHPNQVVYFNALAGGPRGAAGRFELDYWGNSYLQAVAWSARLAREAGVLLTVAGRPERVVRFNARRFPAVQTSSLGEGRHHLELRLLQAETGPSAADDPQVLHVIRMSDGTAIAAILQGPRFREVRARVDPALQKLK